jgi:HEAT repeat protein
VIVVALVLGAVLAGGQDDPKVLVENLRADRPEIRDQARRALKALGAAALPELERAARSSDAELAAQARTLLRVLELLRTFTPRFLREMPGAEEKLAGGGDEVWTEVLLEATSQETKESAERARNLQAADLQPLIDRAARGARTAENKVRICQIARLHGLVSCAPTLRGFLADPNPNLQGYAAEALGVLGFKDAVPDLVRRINDHSDERFFEALLQLDAKAELLALLEHEDAEIRGQAALKLTRVDWPEARPPILKLLRDPDPTVRARAAEAAAFAGMKEAIPLIVPLLKEEDFDVVYYALHALAELQAKEAVPEIEKVLDRPGQLCGEAADVLARLSVKEAIPKILAHLDNPDENAQMRIAEALASLGAKEAVPWLVKMTKNNDFVIRQVGLQSLVNLLGKEAVPHLRRLLKDPEDRVLHAAIELAERVRARELLPELRAMTAEGGAEVRRSAVMAVAQLGGAEEIPLLARRVEDEAPQVRTGAVWGLGRVGATGQRTLIEGRLQDPDAFVREAAVEALGRLGSRESVPKIEALLADRSPKTALTAAKALCLLGSRKGGSLALDNPENRVYLNALRCPEEWKRLEADSRNGYRDGIDKELVEEVAAQAKLTVEWPSGLSEIDRRHLAAKRVADMWKWDEPLSIRDVLEVLLPRDLELVLEPGRLRIVPHDAAREFWRDWLR